MKNLFNSHQSKIKIATIFVIIGLLVELITIFWIHSFAFLIFAFVGLTSMGIGIAIFLTSLIQVSNSNNEESI